MGRIKNRDIRVLVAEQIVQLYGGEDLYLTSIYIKDNNKDERYYLAKTLQYDEIGIGGISEEIAYVVREWYEKEYGFDIERVSESNECEYCGYYTNTQTTIVFKDCKLKPIKIYNDEHLNDSYGYLNEEIIADWKENNVTVEFKEVR